MNLICGEHDWFDLYDLDVWLMNFAGLDLIFCDWESL